MQLQPKENRITRYLIAFLAIGVWGVLIRLCLPAQPVIAQGTKTQPKEVGRYQMQLMGGAMFVIDTKTGTVRGWTTKPFEATWEKNYKEMEKVSNGN